MSVEARGLPVRDGAAVELAKLAAFLRRDLLVAWSYRLAFVSEWVTLVVQAITFYFVSRLVSPDVLPAYGGTHATYMQFVSIGMVVAAVLQLAMGKVAAVMRAEQLMGTLESLLLTPTRSATIQVGTVLYDFMYIPLRMVAFLAVIVLAFGLDFQASGVLPAMVLLVALVPFVWGVGIANAAATITFRRGGSPAGIVMTLMSLGSGAYFPLSVFPHDVAAAVEHTPIAFALDGMRQSLIGGRGWAVLADWNLALLLGCSIVSLLCGLVAFRAALRREWRRGSLGLY